MTAVTGQQDSVLGQILVAVGGSESSYSALNYAFDLAQADGRAVNALIIQESWITPELIYARGQHLSRLAEELALAIRHAADDTERRILELAKRREVAIRVQRATGIVSDCVVAAAGRSSLLILGRQGHRVSRGGLLGSNTESIVRRTHEPLLIAPREHRRVRHVLVAFGGKDLGGLALDTGRDFARALRVPLEVLTVAAKLEVASATQERARARLSGVGSQTTFSVETGDTATEIIARSAGDTLVVMGAYGHSRLYHMMLGSVTEQVVRFAQGPVLLSAKQVMPSD